jgi:hypothetical protein
MSRAIPVARRIVTSTRAAVLRRRIKGDEPGRRGNALQSLRGTLPASETTSAKIDLAKRKDVAIFRSGAALL